MNNSETKRQILREFQINPSIGFLHALELLKRDVNEYAEKEIRKIKSDIENELKKEQPNLEKILQTITGNDGEDSDPEEVAKFLLEIPEFVEMTKGEKGDSVKGDRGDKGDAYILRESDKKDIASKIKIPIIKQIVVEKRETIIKERPVEVVKQVQVAITEKPEIIADKLNTLEEKVDKSVIKGLVNWMINIEKSLRDVRTKKGPKLGGHGAGTGGGSFTGAQELSTTTPNSSTRVFNFTHTPTIITWNGKIQNLTAEYTVTGALQITFVNDGAHTPSATALITNFY